MTRGLVLFLVLLVMGGGLLVINFLSSPSNRDDRAQFCAETGREPVDLGLSAWACRDATTRALFR